MRAFQASLMLSVRKDRLFRLGSCFQLTPAKTFKKCGFFSNFFPLQLLVTGGPCAFQAGSLSGWPGPLQGASPALPAAAPRFKRQHRKRRPGPTAGGAGNGSGRRRGAAGRRRGAPAPRCSGAAEAVVSSLLLGEQKRWEQMGDSA